MNQKPSSPEKIQKNGRALLIALVATLALAGAFLAWKRAGHQSPDLAILGNEALPESERYSALLRLAQKGDRAARKYALDAASGSSELFRQGAAEALGYFGDLDATQFLQRLAQDRSEKIRAAALRAMRTVATPERARAVKDSVANAESLGAAEKIAAYGSLAAVDSSEAALKQSVDGLVAAARAAGGSAEVLRAVGQELLDLAPRSEAAKARVHEILLSDQFPDLSPSVIARLASARDPWLKSNLKKLLASPHAVVRLQAVQAIPAVCPSDRWELLRGVLATEKDGTLLQVAAESIRAMPGPDAEKLQRQILDGAEFQPELKNRVRQTREEDAKNPRRDPCL